MINRNIKPIRQVLQTDGIGSSTAKLLGLLGLVLILAPKVNLIAVSGQTAGLRVDDLLLAFVFTFISYAVVSGRLVVLGVSYYLVIVCSFASFLFARQLGWSSNPLYVIRLIEYSIFIYLGYFFSRWNDLSYAAIVILVCNAFVMFLQALGVWGGFTSDGYVTEVGRLVGLTAGPWEIGFILNIIFVIFLQDSQQFSRSLLFRSGLILLLILLTGSRASAAVFLLISLIEVFRRNSFTRALYYLTILMAAIIYYVLLFGEQLLQRSENVFEIENINYFLNYYENLSPAGTFSIESFEDTESISGLDASWIIRSSHWAIAFKEYFANIIFIPFGLGPGTFGPALDGAWTRILIEGGLIGIFSYIYFLRKFSIRVQGGGVMVIAAAINMAFIDIHMSYKSMALLLFVFGFNFSKAPHGTR